MTRDELKTLIQTDPRWTIGALLRLFALQTEDEQNAGGTLFENDVGFNGTDSGFCSDLARRFQRFGWFSDAQVRALQKLLPKYTAQLIREGGVVPVNQREQERRPDVPKEVRLLNKEQIMITFPFDRDTVAKVKVHLTGRKWDGETKVWTADLSVDNVDALRDWGFTITTDVQVWYSKATAERPDVDLDFSVLPFPLYRFQEEGIKFITKNDGRVLIGDEMGLGKTVQALGYLALNPELRPAVIVVPASLKLNWARETKKWIPGERVAVHSGRRPLAQNMKDVADVHVINYDILSTWVDALRSGDPKVVIMDEVHYTKSTKAQRTKAVKDLCKGVPHVLALSGTPIVNRPAEMFNALQILRKDLFPSFWRYAHRYCDAHSNGFGWDFTGASNTDELHVLLTRNTMIRRLKENVLKDLPPKRRALIPMDLENRDEYDEAAEDLVQWLMNEGETEKAQSAMAAEALVRIESLKQLAVKGKLTASINWIKDFVESGEKLVVFATHKVVITALMEALGKEAVKVDGSVAMEARQAAVDAFQNDPNVKVFVGNIKAAGVGLTLTAASNVVFLELGWTPGDMTQAEDRCHRIGQDSDSVTAWYLLAENTIEEQIAALIDKKAKVLGAVLDGQKMEESSILGEIIKSLRGEKEAA